MKFVVSMNLSEMKCQPARAGLKPLDPEKIKELISDQELEDENKMLEEGLKEIYNYKIENIGVNTFAHSGVDFKLLEKIS